MIALALCGLSLAVLAADDLDSLEADFLSYLAEFENEQDDWTVVEKTPAAATPGADAHLDASSSKSSTPAKQPAVPKQPAPGGDER